ncbi:helix-turn-helix domain-containing protein (plasmid) [Streptomyces sp. BI20]|uniref:helix-turn-helix domain-containing protein n=1 Tax=Streptomyces sp. BI20 TaxID=3403460 RepID=UPI003C7387C3
MVHPEGIGPLLRAVRKRANLSRQEIATRMSAAGPACDAENVKRWETEKRLPSPMWHPALRTVYKLSDEALTAALKTSRTHRRHLREGTDPVERRRLMTIAAVTAGATALPGIAAARDRIDAALDPDQAGDLAYLEAAFERHRGGYNGRAPDTVLAEMEHDLLLLDELLRRPHPARDRTDLARTTAGIAGLVAIVQHDRGDQPAAHGWFTTARRAAVEAGDRRMSAWILARHAMLGLNYGAPEQAARLAAQARAEAGTTPNGAAALAAAVTARALATLHDTAGARRAVADAEFLAEHLDGPEAADTWFGYPEQKHHVHLSQAHTLLADTRAAHHAQHAALALTTSPSVMTRALIAMDTATCLHIDGDPTTAAHTAVDILHRLPTAYRTGLVRTRAQALHRRLDGTPRRLLGEALTDR